MATRSPFNCSSAGADSTWLTALGWTVMMAINACWRAASDKRTTAASSCFAGAAGAPASPAAGGVPRPQPTDNAVNRITAAVTGVVNRLDGL
jgi:hypothetical protein